MSTDDADDIVIVPDSATVASAAATHTALTLAAVPVYAFTGVTRWVYQAASAVGAWFTTPEYDATKVEDAIDKLQSTLDFLDDALSEFRRERDDEIDDDAFFEPPSLLLPRLLLRSLLASSSPPPSLGVPSDPSPAPSELDRARLSIAAISAGGADENVGWR